MTVGVGEKVGEEMAVGIRVVGVMAVEGVTEVAVQWLFHEKIQSKFILH